MKSPVECPYIMKLSNLLEPDRIILEMKADGHWSAINELVHHLVNSGRLPEKSLQDTLDALKAREDQISTGIGSGVAIPHAFSDDIDEVAAIFGRSDVGIDFQSLDQQPVHYIMLFIVPSKDYQLHLRTLSAIAKIFTNIEVLEALGKANSEKDIMDIFASKPSRNTTKVSLPPPPAKP